MGPSVSLAPRAISACSNNRTHEARLVSLSSEEGNSTIFQGCILNDLNGTGNDVGGTDPTINLIGQRYAKKWYKGNEGDKQCVRRQHLTLEVQRNPRAIARYWSTATGRSPIKPFRVLPAVSECFLRPLHSRFGQSSKVPMNSQRVHPSSAWPPLPSPRYLTRRILEPESRAWGGNSLLSAGITQRGWTFCPLAKVRNAIGYVRTDFDESKSARISCQGDTGSPRVDPVKLLLSATRYHDSLQSPSLLCCFRDRLECCTPSRFRRHLSWHGRVIDPFEAMLELLGLRRWMRTP